MLGAMLRKHLKQSKCPEVYKDQTRINPLMLPKYLAGFKMAQAANAKPKDMQARIDDISGTGDGNETLCTC